jgi:O-antigen/teichoic acid export membrane protein
MRSVLSNFLALAFSNVFSLGLNFVYTIILLQRLSPEAYGLYSAVISFATIVTGISYMGLLEIGTRELSRRSVDEHATFYGNLIALHLIISSVVCLCSIGFVLLNRSFTGEAFPIFLLALFTLVLTFAPTVPTEALLIARGKIKMVAVLQSFYALTTAVSGSLILIMGGGLGALYVTLSIVSLLTIIVYLYEAHRTLGGGFRLNINKSLSFYLLSQGFPGALAVTFYAFCMKFSTYFVFTYVGSRESGYLGVSSILVQAVTSIVWIPYAINILPIMTRIHMTSSAQLKWIGGRSLTILLAITLPIAAGTVLMASDILAILSKAQTPAASTVQVFIWILPVSIVAGFSYRWLLILSKQHIYLLATAMGAGVTILVCLALVPSVSPACSHPLQSLFTPQVCAVLVPSNAGVVAAWAALAALIMVDVVCLWNLRGWLHNELRLLDAIRILAGIAGMVLALQLIPGWSSVMRILVGGLVYGSIVVVSGILPLHELKTLRTLLVQNTRPT